MLDWRPARALRALSNRDYRLFFFGQGVSLIGTWMQNIASNWLMYRMTGSPFMLGLSGFLSQMPIFVISPFAGVIGDRVSRRRILLIVQTLAMFQAFVFAAVTLTGTVKVWHILMLNLALGIINSFEMPVRQAFVIQMIKDKADLPNAIALNSSIFNASRLIGPALAGIIAAAAGEGICFLINGISYIAVIAAFISMNVAPAVPREQNGDIISDLKDGISYAFGSIPIRAILLLIASVGLFGMSFPVLLPVFAVKIFGGGSHIFGMLVSFTGTGAFLATVYLAMRKSIQGQGRVMNISVYILALSLIGFSLSKNIFISSPLLVLAGFSMIVVIASCNMVIQSVVDEDKRGRVMSFYVMAFTGTAPLGVLLAGTLSSKAGAPVTLLVYGSVCFIIGIVFSLKLPSVREYVRTAILSKKG